MMISSIKIVGIYIDKQPQYLTEDISPKYGLGDKGKDSVDALSRIFGCNIAIGNGSDKLYSIIDDIGIHSIPGEEGHLIESPTVIDPHYHGCVGPIVVSGIEIHA